MYVCSMSILFSHSVAGFFMFDRGCASLVFPSPHSVAFICTFIDGGVEASGRSFRVSCTSDRVSRTILLGCALQVLMPVACSHSEMVVVVHCDAPELSPYQRDDHQKVRAIK